MEGKITIYSSKTPEAGNKGAPRNPKEARTEVKPLTDVSGSPLIAELHRKPHDISQTAASTASSPPSPQCRQRP